jgi:hypothetical protein
VGLCWDKLRGTTDKKTAKNIKPDKEIKITEIYFRCSRYRLQERFDLMKGQIDWKTGGIAVEFDEPFDQLEWQGGKHFGPVVSLAFDAQGSSKMSENLQDNSIMYYLLVPSIEDLTTLGPEELAAIEMDNTLDAPFVRKTSLAYAEGYGPAVNPVPAVGRGYSKPFMAQGAQARDSVTTSGRIPLISKSHFEKGKAPEPGKMKCVLFVGEFKQSIDALNIWRPQIQRRMEERAQFFHQLELRRAKRNGQPAQGDLEYFRQQERENLPNAAKFILEANLQELLQKDFKILYSRRYPGTKQFNTYFSSQY